MKQYIANNVKIVMYCGLAAILLFFLSACSSTNRQKLNNPSDLQASVNSQQSQSYLIGPGDVLNVFVWGNDDLTMDVRVRPDGRISTPLVEDVVASGKTPVQLAREMEKQLAKYIKNPVVTVIVREFVGTLNQQIRIVGEATEPQVIPFRENLTLLDVMIAVDMIDLCLIKNKCDIKKTC